MAETRSFHGMHSDIVLCHGFQPVYEVLSEERPFPGLESFNFDLAERDAFNKIPFDCDGVARSAVCFDSGGYRYILAVSVLFRFCGVEFNRVTDVTKTDT